VGHPGSSSARCQKLKFHRELRSDCTNVQAFATN
jgi:hypothetical protein